MFEPVNHFTVFGRAQDQILEKCPSVLLFLRGQYRLIKDRLLGGRDTQPAIAALTTCRAVSNWLWAAYLDAHIRRPGICLCLRLK